MPQKTKTLWRAAVLATTPIFFGYFFIGTAYGLLLQQSGYGAGWAALISLVVYAGSMQFVLLDLLAHWSGLLQAALLTFAVNIRHAVYGLSLIEPFAEMGARKPYMIFSLTDETYSVLCSAKVPAGISRRSFFFAVALLDQFYWILGSVVGSVAGQFIKFDTTGIDFAMTAFFLVIVLEQLLTCKCRIPAVTGTLCAVFSLMLFGPDRFLPPALTLMLVLLLGGRRRLEARFDALTSKEVSS